jgi:hypothetical protein
MLGPCRYSKPLEIVRKLLELWGAAQMKRRGRYPAHRVLALREFSQSTPLWQGITLFFVSPFPSLVVIMLFEFAQLTTPDAGPEANYVFYIREFVTCFVIVSALLQQLCTQIGPALPISGAQIVLMSLLAVPMDISFTYLLASTIGFPVPFTIQMATPCHIFVQFLLLGFYWRDKLRSNPAVLLDIARAIKIFACIAAMLVVYPVYYHVFTLLPVGGVASTAFLCLLPMVKLVVRQLFYRCARKEDGGGDLIPQFIVFNVDVMGALFIAFCMQFTPSLGTALAFTGMKLLQAMVLHRDIQASGRKLYALRNQLKDYRQSERRTTIRTTTLQKIGVPKMSVLDEVSKIIERHGLDQRKTSREELNPLKSWGKLSENNASRFNRLLHIKRVIPLARPPTPGNDALAHPDDSTRAPEKAGPMITMVKPIAWKDTDKHPSEKSELELLERNYAEFTMRFLYMTECVILVEYVEVIIPVIYSKWYDSCCGGSCT